MIKAFRKIRNNMLKDKKILRYFLYAIGEILLIVVGILIALQLQNKNEEKKTKELVNTTLVLIKNEINANKKKIESVKDYHIMVRDTLKKIDIPKTKEEASKSTRFWRGLRTPRLQNAAFQTSIQSGIGRGINPKILQNLNSLYTYQDSYNDYTSKATEIFFNSNFTQLSEFGKIWGSIQISMEDLFYYERELIARYKYNLSKLDSIYSPE